MEQKEQLSFSVEQWAHIGAAAVRRIVESPGTMEERAAEELLREGGWEQMDLWRQAWKDARFYAQNKIEQPVDTKWWLNRVPADSFARGLQELATRVAWSLNPPLLEGKVEREVVEERKGNLSLVKELLYLSFVLSLQERMVQVVNSYLCYCDSNARPESRALEHVVVPSTAVPNCSTSQNAVENNPLFTQALYP